MKAEAIKVRTQVRAGARGGGEVISANPYISTDSEK